MSPRVDSARIIARPPGGRSGSDVLAAGRRADWLVAVRLLWMCVPCETVKVPLLEPPPIIPGGEAELHRPPTSSPKARARGSDSLRFACDAVTGVTRCDAA